MIKIFQANEDDGWTSSSLSFLILTDTECTQYIIRGMGRGDYVDRGRAYLIEDQARRKKYIAEFEYKGELRA